MSLATQADIIRYQKTADRWISKAKQTVQKHRANLMQAAEIAEVGTSAFLFGLAQGKFGGIAVFGLPIDLIAAIGLHVAGFAKVGGEDVSRHFHAFGNGAWASFLGGLGRQVGRSIQTPEDRARMQQYGWSATSGISGMDGATGGASLADEELARMVAAGRR